MNCPKCISPMERVIFGGVEVDRCMDCHGLFFDEFEKDQLLEMKGSGVIDNGDPKLGKQFNDVDRIICPRCSGLMIRMVDLNQPHIWFEHCKVCGGSFFDAGEFRDLIHYTILDFFRDLVTKPRA